MKKEEIINFAASELENELGINKERAQEIIERYIKSLPEQINQLSLDDTAKLKHLVHTIKGTSANLRLQDLYLSAKALDEALSNHQTDNLEQLAENLKQTASVLF